MSLPPWDDHATAPEQCALIASLIVCAKPLVVVESGTYMGHTAYFIASELQGLGRGHLYTADPLPADQLGTLSGLKPWVTFHKGDFLEMLAGIPAVDFAYIDATADGPGGARLRWEHFQAVRAKLRPGGIICVDDTAADDWDDQENGRSAARIRSVCNINFRFLRGLSVFTC